METELYRLQTVVGFLLTVLEEKGLITEEDIERHVIQEDADDTQER